MILAIYLPDELAKQFKVCHFKRLVTRQYSQHAIENGQAEILEAE